MSNFDYVSNEIKEESFIAESKLAEELYNKDNKLCLLQCNLALTSVIRWIYKKEGLKNADRLETLLKNEAFKSLIGSGLWNNLYEEYESSYKILEYSEEEKCLNALENLYILIQWIDKKYVGSYPQHSFSYELIPKYASILNKEDIFSKKRIYNDDYNKNSVNSDINIKKKNVIHIAIPIKFVTAIVAVMMIGFLISHEDINIKRSANDVRIESTEISDAEKQYEMGVKYYYGRGVEQSYSEAAKWYRKAAEKGSNLAQYNLGWCYYNGLGIKKSFTEAVAWYRKAATQGNVYAENNLGDCYYYGNGVEKNYNKAVQWYCKAAEKGEANAQFNLGWCYYNGYGVGQSVEDAVIWYRKAAEQGNSSAQNSLGMCYEYGYVLEQSYEKAIICYQKAAMQGHVRAQNNLGNMYYYGRGVEQSYSEAAEWYKKAAKQGNEDSKQKLKNLLL